MRKVCVWMILLVHGQAFSQWQPMSAEEVKNFYAAIQQAYPKEDYQVDYTKEIYLSVGDTAFQHEKGKVCKGKGLNYAVYSDASTLVQQNDIKVVCYQQNNTVYLMDTDSVMSVFSFEDQLKRLDNYVFTRLSNGTQMIVKAVSKQPKTTIDTEMYVEDGVLTKMIIHLTPGNYVQFTQTDDSSESPFIVLTYSKPHSISGVYSLSAGRFVYAREGKYYLSEGMKRNYQLVDLRAPKSPTKDQR